MLTVPQVLERSCADLVQGESIGACSPISMATRTTEMSRLRMVWMGTRG